MADIPVSTKTDVCEGHDACEPRAFASWSPDVTAEGLAVVRETDRLVPHGCDDHRPHGAQITQGHSSVEVNGLPIGHIGALVDCESIAVKTGRASVVVGPPSAAAQGLDRVGNAESSVFRKVSDKASDCRGNTLFQQQQKNSCAMSSSRMVIAQMTGKAPSEAEIRETGKSLELVHPPSGRTYGPVFDPFAGTRAVGLPGVLAEHGVESHTVETPDKVDAAFIRSTTNDGTTPAIYSVEPGHAVIVDGIDGSGNVLVRDPWYGENGGCQKIPLSKFQGEVLPGSQTVVMGKAPEGSPPPVFSTRSLAK